MTSMTMEPIPAHQKHSDTSLAAATSVRSATATLRDKVFVFIKNRPQGATDEEIAEGLAMEGNTARPRRRELQQQGHIQASNQKRATSTGRNAVVWMAVAPQGA